ncbi:MAG: hypothetical protein IH628_12995 [Proteobacteria bacterium]|nr:hypothetical protein [Pseudomonadota bacterium]
MTLGLDDQGKLRGVRCRKAQKNDAEEKQAGTLHLDPRRVPKQGVPSKHDSPQKGNSITTADGTAGNMPNNE